jgi:hypothetical protein
MKKNSHQLCVDQYIINFQHHEIFHRIHAKIVKNMFVQNLWASKCKMTWKIYMLLLYKWYVFSTFNVLIWNTYDLHFKLTHAIIVM